MIQKTKSASIARKKNSLNVRQMNELKSASSNQQIKHNILAQRFKDNQNQLRNRFKTHAEQQKKVYHFMHLRNIQSIIQDKPQSLNLRGVRRQKNKMIDELKHTLSENKYFERRSQQSQKIYSTLQNKLKKIQHVRNQRKAQIIKLQNDLTSLTQQIKRQKLAYKYSVEESKYHLTKSKLAHRQLKLQQANSVRSLEQLGKEKIQKQKLQIFREKRLKHQLVRKEQKNASMNVSKVMESKRHQAEDLKLQKLFRQLAQKEEVKIVSFGTHKHAQKNISQNKEKTILLEQKINELKKGLGVKVSMIPKISHHRYSTQEKDNSTRSGFQLLKRQIFSFEGSFD